MSPAERLAPEIRKESELRELMRIIDRYLDEDPAALEIAIEATGITLSGSLGPYMEGNHE